MGEVFITLKIMPTSPDVNIEELKKTCEAGDPKSCKVMGDLTRAGLGVVQDNTKAYYYYDKACFDGNKDACNELATMDKK